MAVSGTSEHYGWDKHPQSGRCVTAHRQCLSLNFYSYWYRNREFKLRHYPPTS
jgi:hypothetical protein